MSGRLTDQPKSIAERIGEVAHALRYNDFSPRLRAIQRDVEQLERDLAFLYAFKRSVDEALNSGDGSYRP